MTTRRQRQAIDGTVRQIGVDARLHVVHGGGHLVLFDTPEEVAPVVAGFLHEGHRPWVGTLVS